MLGIVNQKEYDHLVSDTISFYESRDQEFRKEDAIRNASLSAILFILAAKEKGWGTCLLIRFDPKSVKEMLSIDDEHNRKRECGKQKTKRLSKTC